MDKLTVGQTIVFGFLGLYILYGIGGIGITGLLFSFAIGLIVNSYTDNLELTVAGVILSGLVWKMYVYGRHEGLPNSSAQTILIQFHWVLDKVV